MSLIAFINKDTFEVKEDLDDYFYCDYEIRNIISNLNKKGYKTKYSCAGHNEVGLFWPLHKEEIVYLDEYLKDSETDKALHFVRKEKDYFYHKDEKVSTYSYISFEDNYDFKSYPKEFTYELINDKSYISKRIDYYKDENHTIRKTDEEINSEINNTHKDLEEWVEELPIINN